MQVKPFSKQFPIHCRQINILKVIDDVMLVWPQTIHKAEPCPNFTCVDNMVLEPVIQYKLVLIRQDKCKEEINGDLLWSYEPSILEIPVGYMCTRM